MDSNTSKPIFLTSPKEAIDSTSVPVITVADVDAHSLSIEVTDNNEPFLERDGAPPPPPTVQVTDSQTGEAQLNEASRVMTAKTLSVSVDLPGMDSLSLSDTLSKSLDVTSTEELPDSALDNNIERPLITTHLAETESPLASVSVKVMPTMGATDSEEYGDSEAVLRSSSEGIRVADEAVPVQVETTAGSGTE